MAVALKKQRKLTNREKIEGVKPIITEEKKQPVWIGEYRDFLTGDVKPVTKAFLERLGNDLVEWAKTNDSAFRICEFFDLKGIGHSTHHYWIDNHPEFKEKYLAAKRHIGRRREAGAINRKYDSAMIRSNLYQFLEEEREGIMWQASLKKEEKDNAGTQYVVIEKVPESSIVKVRKVDNE